MTKLEELKKAREYANRLGRMVIIFSLPLESRVTDWLYWRDYKNLVRN